MARQVVCPDCGRVVKGSAGLASHAAWKWGHPKAKRKARQYRANERTKKREQAKAARRNRTQSIKKDLAAHKKAQGVRS